MDSYAASCVVESYASFTVLSFLDDGHEDRMMVHCVRAARMLVFDRKHRVWHSLDVMRLGLQSA